MTPGYGNDGRSWWRRPFGVELLLNVLAIIAIPLVARLLGEVLKSPLTAFGLGRLWLLLSGGVAPTDIGVEATVAYGLISPDHTAYDGYTVLDVIGQGSQSAHGQIHPPTSLPMWLPLLVFEYTWWLPFWMVGSLCAIAITMRLLRVPATVAYPVAVAIALTPPGAEALVTSYPVMALGLAAAWRFRHRPVLGGLALGIISAERGVAGLLILYQVTRRRWRLVGVALGVLVALLAIAVVLEPGVIGNFLTLGRANQEFELTRGDLFTPYAVLSRRGVPLWILFALVAAVSLWAWRRGSNAFWVLVWAGAAVSPFGWNHSTIGLLPLAVMAWQSGWVGRACVIVGGSATLSTLPASISYNMGWTTAMCALGVAIVASPIRVVDPVERRPTAVSVA